MLKILHMIAIRRCAALLLLLTADAWPSAKVNPKDGLTYLWIPPGAYSIGCGPHDGQCFNWEFSPRPEQLRKGFWLGKTEVTQQAYRRVIGRNPSRYRGSDLPVEQIGWNDARHYCESVGMRLPTEVEWEYAARGGNPESRYGELSQIAWFDGNSDDRTHEVGRKKPNSYGLFDVLGNVWEWVSDSYGPDPAKRILRGGSFFNLPRDLRVSNRLWASPDTRHRNMGIRARYGNPTS
jgi:formylglycine-generating enzyme required for sulfatase activity